MPRLTHTHTVAVLDVSSAAYQEIAGLLRAADYRHAFMGDGTIDMSGIGLHTTDPELRPCPFCGVHATVEWLTNENEDAVEGDVDDDTPMLWWRVTCSDCGVFTAGAATLGQQPDPGAQLRKLAQQFGKPKTEKPEKLATTPGPKSTGDMESAKRLARE